jgi:tetratricopeptide (TPR) repeat protein
MLDGIPVLGRSPVPPRVDAEKRARAAELLFETGQYREALKQFSEVYSLFEPSGFVIPEVIWNLGRCHEELGDLEEAIRFFKVFEGKVSDQKRKALAHARIEELGRRRIASLPPFRPNSAPSPAASRPAEPKPEPTPTPLLAPVKAGAPGPVSPLRAGLFWGGLGTLAVAGAVHVWGFAEWKSFSGGSHTYPQAVSAKQAAERKYFSAYALYGVGIAAITASLVVGNGRHPLGFGAAPVPGGVEAAIGVRW